MAPLYGEQVVRQTYGGVRLEREDGWTVVFRGTHAILRVQDAHVQSLERLDVTEAPAPVTGWTGRCR